MITDMAHRSKGLLVINYGTKSPYDTLGFDQCNFREGSYLRSTQTHFQCMSWAHLLFP